MKPVTQIALTALAVGGLTFAGVRATAQDVKKPVPLAQDGGMKAEGTIPEVATKAGNFKTLVAALKAAGLVETLNGDGPFTVFAPTDNAFEKLPSGTLDTLLKPENKDKLKNILLYHVVKGKVMAQQVMDMKEAQTVEGQPVKIKVENGKVMLNDKVEVVKADVPASNGVIHAINGVLMPEKKMDRRGHEGRHVSPSRPLAIFATNPQSPRPQPWALALRPSNRNRTTHTHGLASHANSPPA